MGKLSDERAQAISDALGAVSDAANFTAGKLWDDGDFHAAAQWTLFAENCATMSVRIAPEHERPPQRHPKPDLKVVFDVDGGAP